MRPTQKQTGLGPSTTGAQPKPRSTIAAAFGNTTTINHSSIHSSVLTGPLRAIGTGTVSRSTIQLQKQGTTGLTINPVHQRQAIINQQARHGTQIQSTTPTKAYENRRLSGGTNNNRSSFGTNKSFRGTVTQTGGNSRVNSGLQRDDSLTSMIENDFDGLLTRTLADLQGKQPPSAAPQFTHVELLTQYSSLPAKVGPDPSGSIRRQRELEIELYNSQYSIATKVWNHYQQAQQTIIKMKTDIHQFMYNQRTLQEQLTQHRKNFQESSTKLKVLVDETKRHELSLVKIKSQSDQLQNDVHKIEEDHHQQVQRYDIEKQRLDQMIMLAEQNQILNQQKETQIISLHSESTTLQLRLDDITTQLNDLRSNDDVEVLEAREKQLQDVKFQLEYSHTKHNTQLDTFDQTIHLKELQQNTLLQSIGPETRNELLQLQADAVALQNEIDQYTRMVNQTEIKIENFEISIPQLTQQLELSRFDLTQHISQYESLQGLILAKNDIVKGNQGIVEDVEKSIAEMKVKRLQDEQKLRESHDKALSVLRSDRERINETMSTMRTTHYANMNRMVEENEHECMDLAQKGAILQDQIQTRQVSIDLLKSELDIITTERVSLQNQLNEHAKVFAMSGPELERNIARTLTEQAKRRVRIRALERENSTYDDENLLIRRAKLQCIRDSNDAIAQQIVQLGGAQWLDRIQKPIETPTWNNIKIESIPKDYLDSFLDTSGDYLSNTGTIDAISEDEYDDEEEERSATCGEDGTDSAHLNLHHPGGQRQSKQDYTETQSLLSLRSVAGPNGSGSGKPQQGRMGQGSGNGGGSKPNSRLSALPASTISNFTKPIPTGTRPLARAANSNVVSGANGPLGRTMVPTVSKAGGTAAVPPTRPGAASSKIAKSAVNDHELPSYMRSTASSRNR